MYKKTLILTVAGLLVSAPLLAERYLNLNDFETGAQGWGATIHDQTMVTLSKDTPPDGGNFSLSIKIIEPPSATGGAHRGWAYENALDLSAHETLSLWVKTPKPNNVVYIALRDTADKVHQVRIDEQIEKANEWTRVQVEMKDFEALDLRHINYLKYKWSTGYQNEEPWRVGDETLIDRIEFDRDQAEHTRLEPQDPSRTSLGIHDLSIHRDSRPVEIRIKAHGTLTLQEIADRVQDPDLLRVHRGQIHQTASLILHPVNPNDPVTLEVSGPAYDSWWRLHSQPDAPVRVEIHGGLKMENIRMTGWRDSGWDRTEQDQRAYLVVVGGPVSLNRCRFDHLGHTYKDEANGVTFINSEVDIRESRFHDMYLTLFRNCRGSVTNSVFSNHHQYVRLQGCEDMHFDECTFQTSHRSGLQLEHPGSHRILITNSVFRDNERFGLYIYQDDTDNRVENTLFERNNIGVVIERNAHFNVVANCRFIDHDTRAVLIANDCKDNVISGNYIDGCNWHAIAIDDHAKWGPCVDNILIGNTIKNSPVGIHLADNTQKTIVQSNRILGANRYALWLNRDAKQNIFRDNYITEMSEIELMNSLENHFSWKGRPSPLRWRLRQSSVRLHAMDQTETISAEDSLQVIQWPMAEGGGL